MKSALRACAHAAVIALAATAALAAALPPAAVGRAASPGLEEGTQERAETRPGSPMKDKPAARRPPAGLGIDDPDPPGCWSVCGHGQQHVQGCHVAQRAGHQSIASCVRWRYAKSSENGHGTKRRVISKTRGRRCSVMGQKGMGRACKARRWQVLLSAPGAISGTRAQKWEIAPAREQCTRRMEEYVSTRLWVEMSGAACMVWQCARRRCNKTSGHP